MNSLERVKTALGGGIPDRVPVITFTHIGARNLGEELTEHILRHADAEYEFPVREFLANEFPGIGVDVRRTDEMSADGWITRKYCSPDGKIFSDQFRFGSGGMYRSYKKHIFTDVSVIEDLLTLSYVKPCDNKTFRKDLEDFATVADRHNTDHEFCAVILNDPLFFLAGNTDPQDMAIWTILERETVCRYLETVTERMLEYLEYMLSTVPPACVFILGGAEYGIPPLMSPDDFEAFVFSQDRKLISMLHRYNQKVLIHCHGKINAFIPRFIAMGGDGIHPLEPIGSTGDCDIKEIKEKYGRKICLVGNIQYDDFQFRSEEEIRRIVAGLMDSAKAGGGFILSPACPMFHDASTAGKINRNIRAFIDAGIEFGAYPR